MKKRHLMLATVSALGLVALNWAGGPAGSNVRLGPLEWSFSSSSEPATPGPVESGPLVQLEAPREPVS
jgi:hypothetical protein